MKSAIQPFSVLRWTLLTLAGWIVGIALLLLIAGMAEAVKMEGQWMVGLGMSLGVGGIQWLGLRKHVDKSSAWIWTTVVGMTIPWVAADTLRYFLHFKPDNQVVPATLLGAFLCGWLQWKYALRSVSKSAAGWIWTSLVAWSIALAVVLPLGYLNRVTTGLPKWMGIPLAFIILFSGGVVLGWVTGWKLRTTLRASPDQEKAGNQLSQL